MWIPLPGIIIVKKGVAKAPEKKGTTKTPRHKVFFQAGSGYARQTKKASFVPWCLCGSTLFCFLQGPRKRVLQKSLFNHSSLKSTVKNYSLQCGAGHI